VDAGGHRSAIAAMGGELSPGMLEAVQALYAVEQQALARDWPAAAVDCAYGPHERHRLDVYRPQKDAPAPVLLWVHGGGFLRGDKGDATRWPNAHAGRMAAALGMVGVAINYRLAPDHGWPAGGEDVLAAVAWCRGHIAELGGDPQRIVLAGTSAGAAHVATALQLDAAPAGLRGAVLLSGLYGLTPFDDPRDRAYFGEDAAQHPAMASLPALLGSELPLMFAGAEFDPPRFQAEFVGLLEAWLKRRGHLPPAWVGRGHNHFSLAYHLGTADRRLSDEIVAFVREVASGRLDN